MEIASTDTIAGVLLPAVDTFVRAECATASLEEREGRAVSAWERVLGRAQVETRIYELAKACASTTGIGRRVIAVLKPNSVEQVVDIVNIANEFRVPIYPISRGRNWGYGEANPSADGCAIVELSIMNRIIHVDEQLGVATLEPGVTQSDLYEYLTANGIPFMVPTHGGGPDCSLVGNALERGYGLTEFTDHFGSVHSLQAVLPNGEIYEPCLSALGASEADQLYRWDIGPDLKGLFSQGNFGIVTRATIALAPRPECIKAFVFSLPSEEYLPAVVERTQELLTRLRSTLGGINLMNALRVLAMIAPYPRDLLGGQLTLSEANIDMICRRERIGRWIGVGYLSGIRGEVNAAVHEVRKQLQKTVRELTFFDRQTIKRGNFLCRLLPEKIGTRLRKRLNSIDDFLDVVSGVPSRVALPLAYWKSDQSVSTATRQNPALDGCGLIWYSPIIPMRSSAVMPFVEMATSVCRSHGIEPLITLTSLSRLCFDSTIPILFDRTSTEEFGRARACFEELFRRGLALGHPPYRIGIDQMELVTGKESAHSKAVGNIKRALDPNNIISPGRYSSN